MKCYKTPNIVLFTTNCSRNRILTNPTTLKTNKRNKIETNWPNVLRCAFNPSAYWRCRGRGSSMSLSASWSSLQFQTSQGHVVRSCLKNQKQPASKQKLYQMTEVLIWLKLLIIFTGISTQLHCVVLNYK